MDEFFCNSLYNWLNFLCGSDLDNYLAGYNAETGEYYVFGQTGYPFLGTTMLAVSLIVCFAYYYSPLTNRPTTNRWWHWVIAGCIGGLINLIVGTVSCNNAINSGDLANALGITDAAYLPSFGNCLGFGFENFILSFALFFIFSCLLKWGSRNCKHTPF